jgi:hypothetical protein
MLTSRPPKPLYKTLQLRRNRHHYCTAQTHENIRTERKASDIFPSVYRTGIACDSRHLYQSTGYFIPPLFVFPRKNMKQELMIGTPPGSIHACHPSWCVDKELDIFQWFLHFIEHTKPTKEDPVILILDGHYSHTRNLEAINLARESHVDIICLPPHSSHKMQPWD